VERDLEKEAALKKREIEGFEVRQSPDLDILILIVE
jgi:hypothetical protein